jgi:putative tryptophan/tyrosine transport system substrate-binding protein
VRRREFITLLGGAAVTCPLAARAQQPSIGIRKIGMLMNGAATEPFQSNAAAFVEVLRDLGWVDGQNARIELR